MDLQDQLKKLFPDHEVSSEPEITEEVAHELLIQKEPMICKFEKRKGKPTTIIAGYEGADEDFKILAKEIKKERATRLEGSFGKEKEHYHLKKIKARTQKSEILWIFFGIHTANALEIGRRIYIQIQNASRIH